MMINLNYMNRQISMAIYGPYPQSHQKIKMAAIVGGFCMECLWRGWRFAMIDMKKLQNIFGCGIYTIIQW